MKKLLVMVMVLALVLMACSQAVPTVTPKVSNVGGTVGATTDFTIQVQVTNIVNFDAANYDITFDPALVSVSTVRAGLIGTTAIPADTWSVVSPGTLRIINNLPGINGVSGSGYLAEIDFTILAAGTVNLGITNGILSDTSAHAIIAKWLGVTVNPTVIQLVVK